ncbi:hypothetical protein [Tenacibaculum sp. nBUS_03]|uniref:hypothetical protein n=1 Tax=Tenacibaculum sp. nBUS_03 TaxID=3395320 RepID=UPI003EBD0342
MKRTKIFIALILLTIISGGLFKYFLNIDELVFNFYAEELAQEKAIQLLKAQKKWDWLGYAIAPLIILIRSGLVAMSLSIGMFFYDMEYKLKFNQFFRLALLGEFVLVLVGFVKLGYFYFIKTDYTLQDIQQYYPLSYINFLDIKSLEAWLIYPLQTINLFEIGYFFVLVYGLHKLLKNKYWKSFEITAVSYGTGLVIWMGLVMFLTLNMS